MTAPTSDERREVAERLRDDNYGYEVEYGFLIRALGMPRDGRVPCDWSKVHERLADLIEPQERTCRILQAYGDESEELDHRMEEIADTPEDTVACICQSCGHEFRYERMVRPTFCPNCGARNVTEVD